MDYLNHSEIKPHGNMLTQGSTNDIRSKHTPSSKPRTKSQIQDQSFDDEDLHKECCHRKYCTCCSFIVFDPKNNWPKNNRSTWVIDNSSPQSIKDFAKFYQDYNERMSITPCVKNPYLQTPQKLENSKPVQFHQSDRSNSRSRSRGRSVS